MYIIHLKYIKSNKKSMKFYIRPIYSSSIIILFQTFARFWLYLLQIFAISRVSLLPIQPLIIIALVYCLHHLYFWCIFQNLVQIFPRFSTKFYFQLLSLHTIIKSFFDVLHSFIKGCNFKKVGAFGYFFPNFPQTFIFGCYL